MKLNVLCLMTIFILTCTRVLAGGYRLLGLSQGAGAALALVCLALSAFPIQAGLIQADPSMMLILGLAAAGLKDSPGGVARPLVLSLVSGVSGWLITLALPVFGEPGMLVALPTLLSAAAFGLSSRAAAASAAAAPVVYALVVCLEDWYLFGADTLSLNPAGAAGAQAFGLMILFIFLSLRAVIGSKRRFQGALLADPEKCA